MAVIGVEKRLFLPLLSGPKSSNKKSNSVNKENRDPIVKSLNNCVQKIGPFQSIKGSLEVPVKFSPTGNPPTNFGIPPNTTFTFRISHTPSSNDLETASIKFYTNDNRFPEASGFANPTYVKEVLVTGGLAKPEYKLLTTGAVVFEDTGIGRTNSSSFTIKNIGSASLILSDESESFNNGYYFEP